MKIIASILLTFSSLLLTCANVYAAPAAASAAALAPYDGHSGYQEIKLSDKSWYLAYFGNRQTDMDTINAAWAARAAQLCLAQHSSHYVEMRYVSERLSADDKIAISEAEDFNRYLMKTGVVYIPIYVPASRPSIVASEPRKMSAISCIDNPVALFDVSRAVDVQSSLDAAAKIGIWPK